MGFPGQPTSETRNNSGRDYYSDDYDAYSSDDDLDDGVVKVKEQVVYVTPEFTSFPSNQLINEGDTIKLPCKVDKIGTIFISSLVRNNLSISH